MIKEQLVSFEVAQLLKAKGFNIIVTDSYRANGQLRGEFKFCNYPAPTQQMAMRWLREKHLIHIEIEAYPHEDGCFYWCCKVFQMDNVALGYYKKMQKAGFDSYEDAIEYAIKDCLKNDFYETGM